MKCPKCDGKMKSNKGNTGGVDIMLTCQKCGFIENICDHKEDAVKLKIVSERSMKRAYQKGRELKAEFDDEDAHCSQSYRLMEISFLYGLLGFHWDKDTAKLLEMIR